MATSSSIYGKSLIYQLSDSRTPGQFFFNTSILLPDFLSHKIIEKREHIAIALLDL